MICPAAQSIQESIGTDDLESAFAEIVLWYGGFEDKHRMLLLPHRAEDVGVIQSKRERCRAEKDYKTADYLRGILEGAGIRIRDK